MTPRGGHRTEFKMGPKTPTSFRGRASRKNFGFSEEMFDFCARPPRCGVSRAAVGLCQGKNRLKRVANRGELVLKKNCSQEGKKGPCGEGKHRRTLSQFLSSSIVQRFPGEGGERIIVRMERFSVSDRFDAPPSRSVLDKKLFARRFPRSSIRGDTFAAPEI